jgi:hypothetical protein
MIVGLLFQVACFLIIEVDQPSSATAGGKITVTVTVQTDGDIDQTPQFGIFAVLIPNDWAVDTVHFAGAFGPGGMSFLHPDSGDGNPGGQVDFWADSIEVHYPSGDDMNWVVYQSDEGWTKDNTDTGFVDVTVEMTVGQTGGTFDLGYFVTDASLDFGVTYGAAYSDSSWFSFSTGHTIDIGGATSVEDDDDLLPTDFGLSQNFPNPFNPSTTIRYAVKERAQVTLVVYDLLGKQVATLVDEVKSPGSYDVSFSGTDLANGVYVYKLTTPDFAETRKMILLK